MGGELADHVDRNHTPRCAVLDHRHHAPCAICSDAYGTRFICPGCRADPANDDWAERSALEVLDGDVDETALCVPAGRSRAERAAELERNILDCLLNRSVRAPVRVRVRRGGLRVWEWRWESRSLTFREVAWLVGCSEAYVRRICDVITRR